MMNYHKLNLNFPLITISHTDSSINYLNELSKDQDLEEFTTVLVYYQTAGRGQRGAGWESEPNLNLLFSFIVYPEFIDIKKQFLLSQIVSLSIKETLDLYIPGFTIKWPNDIYWKECKICGTLIENDLQGSKWKKSITGIGININQQEFKSDAPNPISLIQITGEENDFSFTLAEIMKRIINYYSELREGNSENIVAKYHNSLFRKDGFHRYRDKNGEFKAKIKEVLPEGFLVLLDETGCKREYAFKEVEYVLIDN